jgi:hypothetical protein
VDIRNLRAAAAVTATSLVLAAGVFLAGHAVGERAADAHASTPAPVAVQEDDPRWNCATMGNRRCLAHTESGLLEPGGLFVYDQRLCWEEPNVYVLDVEVVCAP